MESVRLQLFHVYIDVDVYVNELAKVYTQNIRCGFLDRKFNAQTATDEVFALNFNEIFKHLVSVQTFQISNPTKYSVNIFRCHSRMV